MMIASKRVGRAGRTGRAAQAVAAASEAERQAGGPTDGLGEEGGDVGSSTTHRPGSPVLVVFGDRVKGRCLERFAWGLQPPGAPSHASRAGLHNIRVESVREGVRGEGATPIQRFYAEALIHSRGIVPASVLFERMSAAGQPDGRMYRIRDPHGRPLCVASLYAHPSGFAHASQSGASGAGLTAEGAMSEVAAPEERIGRGMVGMLTVPHPRFGRLPLLLPFGESVDRWLDPEIRDPDTALSLLALPQFSDWTAEPV